MSEKKHLNITEQHIAVQRTARYFTYGELSEQTKYIWFALHGYAMLASSLIKRMQVLNPKEHFVVAPEGLSRFYWNGFGGKPVASWMTSEDRLNEIKDYIAYLNQLYQHIIPQVPASTFKINALGFSQGTATAARWLASDQCHIDHMIFWAGPLPHDVDWDKSLAIFNAAKVMFVLGTQDQFIKEEHWLDHQEKMNKLGLSYETMTFEGKHELDGPTLLKVVDWCNGQ